MFQKVPLRPDLALVVTGEREVLRAAMTWHDLMRHLIAVGRAAAE